jgi:rfaE bifunctional protein nucleotidyltransferase chain/domain
VHKAVELVARRRPVLIDAHDLRPWAHARAALVTPNWSEASQLIGQGSELRGVARIAAVDVMADRLLQVTGARQVVVTLDADGAVLIRADGLRHQPTRRIADAHSAGAGDTAAAALALGLAAGSDLHDALELAVAAATVVVQRPGTATCSQRDLAAQEHLLTVEQLVRACDEHRAIGRRIAFTNGCFDVLHAGHIACLREAAAAADVVVVGLNDDAGVRSIKGPGRPVNRLPDRAEVLAALDTVDHLVAFDGATPLGLIEAITPDVYVKGADHDVSRLPEAQAVRSLGGVVHTVTLLPDRSTSGVIAACAASLEATG